MDSPSVREAIESAVQEVSDACVSQQGVLEAHQAMLTTVESLNIHKQLKDYDTISCR